MGDQPAQFSLRYLIALVTGAALACGAAVAWVAYVRHVEAETGYIPLGVAHLSVLLAVFLGTVIVGLTVTVPLCFLLAWSRRRPH
jgi:hypothetical protein